jgi:hypothetical protein
VGQNPDGSYSWTGRYKNLPIIDVSPQEGARCIILLDPDARNASVFENLLCIDRTGQAVWVAKLPSTTDVFLNMHIVGNEIRAYTWEGFLVFLDKESGVTTRTEFVK